MKSLVVGASGQVGSCLYHSLLAKKFPTQGTYNSVCTNNEHFKLDISKQAEVEDFFKQNQYDVVFLPGAITHVDLCENSPIETAKINVAGIQNIVRNVGKSLVVFFSTDYVFDGKTGPYKESDLPNPICEYGAQKLTAEHYIKATSENYRIIRTNGVFGPEPQGKNFVLRLVENLKQGKKATIPFDEFGTPTYGPDLVKYSIELAISDEVKNGIYHISGPTWLSRYNFSLDIAKIYGYDLSLIEPILSSSLNRPAKRPLKAGLINSQVKPHSKFISHLEALEEMKND